jgi:hypothetical protein
MIESIIETKAASVLEFLHGLRGESHVTSEGGTWAAWLYYTPLIGATGFVLRHYSARSS